MENHVMMTSPGRADAIFEDLDIHNRFFMDLHRDPGDPLPSQVTDDTQPPLMADGDASVWAVERICAKENERTGMTFSSSGWVIENPHGRGEPTSLSRTHSKTSSRNTVRATMWVKQGPGVIQVPRAKSTQKNPEKGGNVTDPYYYGSSHSYI